MQTVKTKVINRIANGMPVMSLPRWKYQSDNWYRVDGKLIHTRYISKNSEIFGIYASTLERADFEVWICGSEDHYYLIPIEVLRDEYPSAFSDNRCPDHRLMHVDIYNHHVIYGLRTELYRYFKAALPGGPVFEVDVEQLSTA
jgi:hypothetical protein